MNCTLFVGMLLLLVYQISIEFLAKPYNDDSANFFLTREYFERYTPVITLVGALIGWVLAHRLARLHVIPLVTGLTTLITTALLSQHYLGFAAASNNWIRSFFGGFGTRVSVTTLILAVIASLGALNIPQHISRSDASSLLKALSFIAIVVFYFPASLVTSQSIFHTDFTYVLNELLGPASGHPTLLESAPQYSSLLGWPLKTISWIDLSLFLEVSILYVSVLFLVIIALIALVLRDLFQDLPIQVCILIPMAILLARPGGQTSGSFIMFPSAIVRNFLPIILISLLYFSVKRGSAMMIAALGLVASICAVNNLEFGLVCVLAVTSSIAFASVLKVISFRLTVTYFVSVLVGAACLLLILNLGGDDWSRYKFFATAYGGGNNNIPMPIFGLHSLTMAIAASSVILGIRDTLRFRTQVDNPNERLTPGNCLLPLAAGLAGCGFHLYYTGRSMVSTQLQTEFPILIICSACLIWRFNLKNRPGLSFAMRFESVPILMIAILPLASLWLAPDPTIEFSRLRGRLPESEYGSTKLGLNQIELSEFSGFLRQSKVEYPSAKIGFVADHNGNALTLIHRLENLLPFNDMNDVTDIVSSSQKTVCESITNSQVDYVAIEKSDDSAEAFSFIVNCPTIDRTPVLQSPFGDLLRIQASSGS
jgi:hypothetical protein